MRPLLIALLLFAFACGDADSPYTGDASACDVSTDDEKPSAGALDVTANELNCTGQSAGSALSCTGETKVSRSTCENGFAFTVQRGDTILLLRFEAKNEETWRWGARLAGAEPLRGAVTIVGLPPPFEPVPPAGRQQALAFALNSDSATVNGEFEVIW